MLQHQIILFFRNIWRNKTFSLLNIFGLAIGITCASFIFLWVEHELSFNNQVSKRDHIYSLMQSVKEDGKTLTVNTAPVPMAAAIAGKFPEVKTVARIGWEYKQLFVLGDKKLSQQGQYADSSILNILDFHFIYGKRPSITTNESIIISESMSRAFFGNDNPVGKVIASDSKGMWTKDGNFIITGVFKDFPENGSWHFNWLTSYEVYEGLFLPFWNKWTITTPTIIETTPHADIAALNGKLKNYMASKVEGSKLQTFVSPMKDWNLYSEFADGKPAGGKIQYIYLFSLIATLILVIACINFMNLSTARSEKRAKEVGVRKISGASRAALVAQFMGESLASSLLAVCCAMLLISLFMPAFNTLIGKSLQPDLFKLLHIGFLLVVGTVCGLLSGFYPAFYLSSFRPAKVLKGLKIKTSFAALFMRKGLVTLQFTISVALIVATLVIYQQVMHVKSRNIGYDIKNMIAVQVPKEIGSHISSVRNDLLKTGLIENAAVSWNPAMYMNSSSDEYTWAGKSLNDKFPIYDMGVSAEYFATMKMKIVAGRDFYSTDRLDSNHTVIINQSLAKLMGDQGKVGAIISRKSVPNLTVIGVVQDFVFNDMYGAGGPALIGCLPAAGDNFFIRYKKDAGPEKAIAAASKVLKSYAPDFVFDYGFVDNSFNKIFETESFIGNLVTVFSVISIFISCLGLFGLAAYTAERRTKEIGIRKILGAGIASLAGLLSKEFLQLVCLSLLIAFPLSWWALNIWLQNYQYRISLQPWPFLFAGIGAFTIALLTVSFQSIKAAMANPVKNLRTE